MASVNERLRCVLRGPSRPCSAGEQGEVPICVAGAFFDKWLERQRAAGKSPNTIANYEWAIGGYIVLAVGNTPIAKLHVDDLLLGMAKLGRAKNTMMRIRAILVMGLKDAERRGLVMRNVAALTSTPAGPERESRSLTLDQARLLLDAAVGGRLEAAWVTMLLLGLRPGEVCGLSWEDVNFDKGWLHVRHARIDEPGGTRIGRTKTRRSIRSLEMPDRVRRALCEHRRRQAEERLHLGEAWVDHGLVFTSSIGTPIDHWALTVTSRRSPKGQGSATGSRGSCATARSRSCRRPAYPGAGGRRDRPLHHPADRRGVPPLGAAGGGGGEADDGRAVRPRAAARWQKPSRLAPWSRRFRLSPRPHRP